ncbi:hypothetical protein ACHAQI_004694 [Fusarium lateritium]
MPVLFPNFDRTSSKAQSRSSSALQGQKDTPLEEHYEATDTQHEVRNLNDRDGNEGSVSLQMRDEYVVHTAFGFKPTTVDQINKPSEPSSNNEISTPSEASTNTDEVDHTTTTVVLTMTESMTFVFVDHSAYYTVTATLDAGSAVPASSNEVQTFSSEISSFNDRIPLFSTLTISDIMSPPKAWSTSYITSQSLPAVSTATVTATSSPQPQFSFSTVEWVGVIIGIICIISMTLVFLLFLFQRRRRASRPAESQNNINIRLENGPPVSRWSRSDSTRTNITPSNYTDSRELRTVFVPRPLGVACPPPRYEGGQKYWTGECQEQDLGIQGNVGESSGSRYAEVYSSGVYNDPKWKGKQREEF